MVSAAIGRKIEKLRFTGLSQRKIAKKLKIAQSTVSEYLSSADQSKTKKPKSTGEKSDHSKTKKANQARIEYCSEKRIALIDKGMARLEDMLPEIDKPSGMRDWFVALGTAIDKRRLEAPEKDGEEDALERLISAIEDHAEAIISPEASSSVPGLPQDPPNLDVRVCEERKD